MTRTNDISNADPMTDWRGAVRGFRERMERDYEARVSRFAGAFGTWASSTFIGYEIPLGGRSGSVFGSHARYARRSGLLGLFGRREKVRDIADIEAEFRAEIDGWLKEQERANDKPSHPA